MKHKFTIPKIWLSTTFAMVHSECEENSSSKEILDFLKSLIKQKGKDITFEIEDLMYLKLLTLFEEISITNLDEASLKYTEAKLKSHSAIKIWELFWDTKLSKLTDVTIPDFLPENLE